MPLNARNQRVFHRYLYAGQLQSITLQKRGNDQQQGTIVTLKLYQCRPRIISKTGETLRGDMSSNHRVEWCLPRVELDRVGVQYINATDRIIDKWGRYWQPESDTSIEVKLFEVHVNVACHRRDPHGSVQSK